MELSEAVLVLNDATLRFEAQDTSRIVDSLLVGHVEVLVVKRLCSRAESCARTGTAEMTLNYKKLRIMIT